MFADSSVFAITIAIVGGFKNLANMTNAYGFSVAVVFFVTTTLVAIQTYYTKHLPWILAVGFFVVSGCVTFADSPVADRLLAYPRRRHLGFSMVCLSTCAASLTDLSDAWYLCVVLGLFFGASLKKVPHGAWVALMIALVLWVDWDLVLYRASR